MAWSYDASDLDTTTASGRLNTVRLLLGDTDTLDQQVQNEEVTFALSRLLDTIFSVLHNLFCDVEAMRSYRYQKTLLGMI